MNTLVDTPPSEPIDDETVKPPVVVSRPDLNKLQDRTPEWLRVSRAAAAWTALLGLLYLILSYQPLYHTDVWGHLAYGRWIWESGRLPVTEPLLPLAEGVPVVDTAWLSQVIGYGMFRQFGVTALQFLFAAPITAACGLLLWGVLCRTCGSIVAGLIALGTFGWVDFQQLLIVRPQLNGLLMFVGLLVLMNACRWRRAFWIVVPAMFALWANLHGSWVVGLGLLGSLCLGRAIDVTRRTQRVTAIFRDRQVRRTFVLTELCAVCVLLNPYGFAIYPEVLAISGHSNLQDLIEWQPLTLRMSQGKAAGVAALALMFVYRLSPRRVTAGEVLLLVGLGGAALWSSRMIHWWAPVAAYYLALHAAAVCRRTAVRSEPQRKGMLTVVIVGVIWICFAYTPFGFTVIHGQPEAAQERAERFARSTSPLTPLAAIGYLQNNPVNGLIYNTYEWGDFLLFAGPRDLQVFTNSHAHLIPREVWEDSLSILRATSGWDDRLDHYGVNAVMLNVHRDTALVRGLKRNRDTWEHDFERGAVVVFRRREPI